MRIGINYEDNTYRGIEPQNGKSGKVNKSACKASSTTEEYYEKLRKKFPQLAINTSNVIKTCTVNKVVVNLSPSCLKRMATDPEFAQKVEWNLSGEIAANALVYGSAKRDGVELGGRTVTYDSEGNRQSSCGGMRTVKSETINSKYGREKAAKRKAKKKIEELEKRKADRKEMLENLEKRIVNNRTVGDKYPNVEVLKRDTFMASKIYHNTMEFDMKV